MRISRVVPFAVAFFLSVGCSGSDNTGPVAVVSSVKVSPTSSSIKIGESQPYFADVTVSNNGSTSVTWNSSSPSVATVSSQGIVTAVGVGTSTIRATSTLNSSISGSATVDVTPLRSVTVTPAATAIFTGDQRTLTADVQLDAGANRAVTWRTSASTIVAVSQAGVVTGIAPGTAIITAVSVADTTLRGTASVTVAPSVRSVVVTPATASLFIGGTQPLAAAVVTEGGLAQTVNWRTSNASVATVSASGVVTAVALGQATITALSTVDTTKRASSAITVSSRPLTVSIVQRNLGVEPGASTQLTVNVAADPGVSTAVNWSSSATSVATISSSGLLTGIGAGSAIITAISQADATRRDTVTVSVVPRLAASWSSSQIGGALTEDIYSIAAFSSTSAFASNGFGDVYRWDGSSWTISARGASFGTQFISLSGTSNSNILAVGTNGVIARFNGSAWTTMTSGTSSTLSNVYMESDTSAFAVGVNGTVLKLSASNWTPLSSGVTDTLDGVWSMNGTAFVVGRNAVLLRYDGTAFVRQSIATAEDFYAVRGTALNNVVAVGSAGTIARFDGTAWSLVNSTGLSNSLYDIVPGASNRYFLAGNDGLFSLDDTTVSMVSMPYTPQLFSLSVDGANFLWTGGQRGYVSRATTAGNSTTFTTNNLAPDLLDVWTTAANNSWTVGEFGFIYRWNGTTWTRQSTPTTRTIVSVWGANASDAFAGGDGGIMLRWNGTVWTSMSFPSSATVLAIWGSASNNVYASTAAGEILRFNGTAWAYSNVVANSLWTIFGASPSDVYAAGTQGFITRYNGTAWGVLPAPSGGLITGVWMSGSNNVLAVGTDATNSVGAAFRFNGTSWQTLATGGTNVLTSVWGPSVSDVYATGERGTILRFNGTNFQTMQTGTTSLLWSVSGSPNGDGGAFAVGINGTIVTGRNGSAIVSGSNGRTYAPVPAGSLDPSSAAMANRARGSSLPTGAARRSRTRTAPATRANPRVNPARGRPLPQR